jgi:hypothetical protein
MREGKQGWSQKAGMKTLHRSLVLEHGFTVSKVLVMICSIMYLDQLLHGKATGVEVSKTGCYQAWAEEIIQAYLEEYVLPSCHVACIYTLGGRFKGAFRKESRCWSLFL